MTTRTFQGDFSETTMSNQEIINKRRVINGYDEDYFHLTGLEMIEEVRRQFREIEGLLDGKADADFARCVDISTQAAIKKMVAPGLLAVSTPVIFAVILPATGILSDDDGMQMLAGVLAGVTVSGVLMAIFMSNAGGAWDNAKKAIEQGEIEGAAKGDDAHNAAVVGDTIGDPFKDTSGPSLNILIKLMSIVSVVIAGMLTKAGELGSL